MQGRIIEGSLTLVNYDLSLQSMIVAGNYDIWDRSILTGGYVPLGKCGVEQVQVDLFHPDRCVFNQELFVMVDDHGFRLANQGESLAFCAQNPEVQRQFPIVVAGSVGLVDRLPHVIILKTMGDLRVCEQRWYDVPGRGWNKECRFPVVKKTG